MHLQVLPSTCERDGDVLSGMDHSNPAFTPSSFLTFGDRGLEQIPDPTNRHELRRSERAGVELAAYSAHMHWERAPVCGAWIAPHLLLQIRRRMHTIRRVRKGTEEPVLRRRQVNGVATDGCCATRPIDGEGPDNVQRPVSQFRAFGCSGWGHRLWCSLQRTAERLLRVAQQGAELLVF